MVRQLAAFTLGVLLLSGYAAYAGVDEALLCKEKKAKATGLKAFDLLKAFGKNEKRSHPAKLDKAISKAQSKFTKGFSKAEAKGLCITSGDSDAIELKVDAFVSDMVAAAAGPDCRAPGADCGLRQAATQVGMLIGTAVRPPALQGDPSYGPALARDFNSLTDEWTMKWGAIHPAPGVYEFESADALVDFAEANGMAVRGHTLIWDQELVDSTPEYVTAITDPQELRDLMTEHIQTVVGHFRGRVDAWDVVNEPLELFGTALYENIFHQLLGPGYIKEALEIAHAADPSAALFLNENLISTSGSKFDAFLALLTDLVNHGAPIHGAGIQGHFFGVVNPEQLHANIEALAALGLTVELTEVDVLLRANGDSVSQLEAQRQEYFEAVRACVTVDACRRFTTWGFTDRYTWIDDFFGQGFDPLLLDEDYARKPAYFGVRDGLLTRPDVLSIPVYEGGGMGH